MPVQPCLLPLPSSQASLSRLRTRSSSRSIAQYLYLRRFAASASAQRARYRSHSASRRRILFCPVSGANCGASTLASACLVQAPLGALFHFLAPAARALSPMGGGSLYSSLAHARIVKRLDLWILSCFLLQGPPIVLSLFAFYFTMLAPLDG